MSKVVNAHETVGCAVARFETLAEACLAYGVPLAQLLEELDDTPNGTPLERRRG